MFNVAGTFKREMAELNARDCVQAVRYQTAIQSLTDMGLSPYQIDQLATAYEAQMPSGGGGSTTKLRVPESGDPHWPKDLSAAMEKLKQRGLITVGDRGSQTRYWLTAKGEYFHNELVTNKPKSNLPVKVEDQQDISLLRDGLLVTASKIWWILCNREAVQQARTDAWIKEFRDGEEEIEKALAAILAPRDPIILQPVDSRPNPFWTEEMQRKQNDLYWMSGGSAFWLNPRGATAEPTPAPDWWSEPKDYRPNYVPVKSWADQVVDASLLPPPTADDFDDMMADGDDPEDCLSQLPRGEMVKNRPEWLCRRGKDGVSVKVWGFDTRLEVDTWVDQNRGFGYTVARKGSVSYPEILEEFHGPHGANVKWIERFHASLMTSEEIADLYKSFDFDRDEEEEARILRLSKSLLYVGVLLNGDTGRDETFGFQTDEDAVKWVEAHQYRAHEVARRGSTKYGKFLRMYAAQHPAAKAVDDLLAALDHINDVTDEHYDYKDWQKEYKTREGTLSGTSANVPVKKGGVKRVDRPDNSHFFMVEHDGEVRGFDSKGEAELWVGEQRRIQKERTERLQRQKRIHDAKNNMQLMQKDYSKVLKTKDKGQTGLKGQKGAKGQTGISA